MSFELLYTSAPAGLKPGTRGFTTVQCTDGIPSNVALRLETLSGYRHLFPPSDPRASENPVCYSHLRVPIAGKPTSVVSRIADYGADYSGRTNKIAHHVVLEPSELTEAGPGWLVRQKNFLRDAWDGTTRLLPAGPVIPSGNSALRVCESWQAITGDAGWGGYLADAIEGSSGKPIWIVFRIDQSSYLPLLIEEALTLLPPQHRWQATFTTYYTNLPPEVECRIRCVVAGSEEAKLAPTRGVVIDNSRPSPVLTSTPRVEAARTGVAVAKIPPVQSSVQRSATGRGPRYLSVEDGAGESLWPDDEIRLAPPAVRASQSVPPAIKNAKDSGPPKIKLPPQVDEKRGVSALLAANGAFIAGLLLLLTIAAIAIAIAYQLSESKQQLASPGAFKTSSSGDTGIKISADGNDSRVANFENDSSEVTEEQRDLIKGEGGIQRRDDTAEEKNASPIDKQDDLNKSPGKEDSRKGQAIPAEDDDRTSSEPKEDEQSAAAGVKERSVGGKPIQSEVPIESTKTSLDYKREVPVNVKNVTDSLPLIRFSVLQLFEITSSARSVLQFNAKFSCKSKLETYPKGCTWMTEEKRGVCQLINRVPGRNDVEEGKPIELSGRHNVQITLRPNPRSAAGFQEIDAEIELPLGTDGSLCLIDLKQLEEIRKEYRQIADSLRSKPGLWERLDATTSKKVIRQLSFIGGFSEPPSSQAELMKVDAESIGREVERITNSIDGVRMKVEGLCNRKEINGGVVTFSCPPRGGVAGEVSGTKSKDVTVELSFEIEFYWDWK